MRQNYMLAYTSEHHTVCLAVVEINDLSCLSLFSASFVMTGDCASKTSASGEKITMLMTYSMAQRQKPSYTAY